MTFNRADASDVEELAELNRQLIEDEQHPNPMTRAELAERMIRWMEEGCRCYVARVEGTTAGYCLFRDDGKHYYLRQLFLSRPPPARDRHGADGLDVRECLVREAGAAGRVRPQ